MRDSHRFICFREEETRRLAARLARRARPRDVACLYGPLGSGKTTFVQGFARGAGFKGAAASPTFTIARVYRAPHYTLYHIDLFRVGGGELGNLGMEEFLEDAKGICLIEWPEAVESLLPADRLEVRFSHRKTGGRTIRLSGTGPRSRHWLSAGARGFASTDA